MAYRDPDDDEADLHDRERPDESDQDEHDDPEQVPCPYCGATISEEAEVCPACGSFLSIEDAPSRRPWWVWAAVLGGLLAVAVWVLCTR